MKRIMQKNFTADELRALTDFYGSSAGKSALKKLNLYKMELMPALQGEMMKMYAKSNREK
jgi:hypothetical protein